MHVKNQGKETRKNTDFKKKLDDSLEKLLKNIPQEKKKKMNFVEFFVCLSNELKLQNKTGLRVKV